MPLYKREAIIKNGIVEISFWGTDFGTYLNMVKLYITGREFNKEKKCWLAPATKTNIDVLKKNNFTIIGEVLEENKDVVIDKKKLKGLRSYQIEAVQFTENKNGYALIADEPGIGKTIEAIGIMKLHKGPFIVICTASMKLKWQREIKKWTGKDAYIVYGEKEHDIPNAPFYIINYNILGRENEKDRKKENEVKRIAKKEGYFYREQYKSIRMEGWWKKLAEKKPEGIIVDECHRVANREAIFVRSFDALFETVKPKIFLPMSGTPIKKHAKNFYHILHKIAPLIFSSRYRFLQEFCNPKHNGFGWVYNGVSNEDKLKELLKDIMIRRLKEDVEKDLPDRPQLDCIPLELTELDEKNYKNALEDFKEYLKVSVEDKVIIRKHIASLRQLAYMAKRNALLTWIEEYIEDHEKIIVAAWHTLVINDIENKFKDILVKIDGSVPSIKRQEAEDRFQNDPKVKMILLQMEAGGEGITLTASDTIVFVELPDSPGQLIQVSDRQHRIGQKHKKLFSYFPFAVGTIEESMANNLDEANRNFKYLFDNKKNEKVFTEDFYEGFYKECKE